jgi:hypothetical protein
VEVTGEHLLHHRRVVLPKTHLVEAQGLIAVLLPLPALRPRKRPPAPLSSIDPKSVKRQASGTPRSAPKSTVVVTASCWEISFVPVTALWAPKKRDPPGTPRTRSTAPSLLAPEKKAPKPNESTAADPSKSVATAARRSRRERESPSGTIAKSRAWTRSPPRATRGAARSRSSAPETSDPAGRGRRAARAPRGCRPQVPARPPSRRPSRTSRPGPPPPRTAPTTPRTAAHAAASRVGLRGSGRQWRRSLPRVTVYAKRARWGFRALYAPNDVEDKFSEVRPRK